MEQMQNMNIRLEKHIWNWKVVTLKKNAGNRSGQKAKIPASKTSRPHATVVLRLILCLAMKQYKVDRILKPFKSFEKSAYLYVPKYCTSGLPEENSGPLL